MTSTRPARQLGTRRLAAATAGLVAVAGAGVAVLVAHDASQVHASTPASGSSAGTGSTSHQSGTPNRAGTSGGSNLSGTSSTQSTTPDATSGGS